MPAVLSHTVKGQVEEVLTNLKFTSAMLNTLSDPFQNPVDYEHLSAMHDLTIEGIKLEQVRVSQSIEMLVDMIVSGQIVEQMMPKCV